MNMRSMHGPRRVDTSWPQTQVMRRPRAAKRRPLIDWRDPFEACGVFSAVVGLVVLAGMFAGAW